MKALRPRPGRRKPKRSAPPIVPEHTALPAKAVPSPEKETAQDEAIRKMLEAAYT